MNKTEGDDSQKDRLWGIWAKEGRPDEYPGYGVFEYTKNPTQSVAMNYEVLVKFCQDFNLPIFTLDVDRIAHMGITEDVEKRYRTWFTVFQGFSFYASKYLDEKGEVKQRDIIQLFKGIIRDIQNENQSAATLEQIISKAEESGIGKDRAEDFIMKLKTIGEILEVSNGRFKVV